MKERAGPLDGWVTYDDPTTGETLFRARTPEDGVLPGDRWEVIGVLEHMSAVLLESDTPGRYLDQLCEDLYHKRVRITVEVLGDKPKVGGT